MWIGLWEGCAGEGWLPMAHVEGRTVTEIGR